MSQWQSSTGQDLHSIIATPSQLFVNPSGNDYQLLSTSPAIDAGIATDAPSTDLAGNPRPSGSGYDIGVYEYQAGFVAPIVMAETPTPNEPNVSNATTVTATFNQSVVGSSITTSDFVLKDPNNKTVTATVSYNDSNHTATLTPSGPLAAGVTYTATISGVKDAAGSIMTAPVSWSFTITATVPTVISHTPASGATGVVHRTTVTATFDESVLGSSITTSNFVLKSSNNKTVKATVRYTRSTHRATLTPSAPLAAGVTYIATISGVKDAAGNMMTAPVSWSFTINATVPTVISHTPMSGATGVVNRTTVTATFNESVVPSSITTSNFVLKSSNNKTVKARVSYSHSTHRATLTPSPPLAAGVTYTATIGRVRDAAGNMMTAPVSWSFTINATIIQGQTLRGLWLQGVSSRLSPRLSVCPTRGGNG